MLAKQLASPEATVRDDGTEHMCNEVALDMFIAPGSDADEFLKRFIRAVQAALPDKKYTGTATIELHFHQGGLSRATSSFKSELPMK